MSANYLNLGFELEGFLTQKEKNQLLIYNAFHELNVDFLGKAIISGAGFEIFPDGTALEIISDILYRPSYDKYEKPFLLHQVNRLKNIIQSVSSKLLSKEILFRAFVRDGSFMRDKNSYSKFINHGYRFSSDKLEYNAYSGNYHSAIKKDDGKVSFRTAGFHIHIGFEEKYSKIIFEEIPSFSVDESWNYKKVERPHKNIHCNHIIQLIDNCFDRIILPTLSEAEIQRENLYMRKGDFRIKTDTKLGLPTLEYRRLSAEFVEKDDEVKAEFISTFTKEVNQYLEKNL